MFINPWDAESERYLFMLAKDKRIFVKDTDFTQNLGKKYRNHDNFFGIARLGNGKETMVGIKPKWKLEPIPTKRKFHSFRFQRIF